MQDKILCFGMLEFARQIVANHDPNAKPEPGQPLMPA